VTITPQEPLIRTEGLVRRYSMGRETIAALRAVDLVIHRGEYAAITGPSGTSSAASTRRTRAATG
jgi:putative ABC transport system ATP-binding protein